MATQSINAVIHHLRRAALFSEVAHLTDGELLDLFLAHRSEAAFEALVHRLGPMVLGVCRRMIGDLHDAEDAFQATFLVLARKAASVAPREGVGNWLYGVAFRTAQRARAVRARRASHEKSGNDMRHLRTEPADRIQELEWLLDEELNRLPDKYRLALILCDLENRPRKEAARQLKLPEGTLSSRLAAARKLLAKRLARHGALLSASALAAMLSRSAAAASVPSGLAKCTSKAASLYAAGQAASGMVSGSALALTEGVMKTMFLAKLAKMTAVVVLLAFSCVGVGFLAGSGHTDGAIRAEQPGEQEGTSPAEKKKGADKDAKFDLQGVWQTVRSTFNGKRRDEENAVELEFKTTEQIIIRSPRHMEVPIVYEWKPGILTIAGQGLWIYAPIPGTVKEIPASLKSGRKVAKGQPLFVMFDSELEKQVNDLQTEIEVLGNRISAPAPKNPDPAKNEGADPVALEEAKITHRKKIDMLKRLRDRTNADLRKPGQFTVVAPKAGIILSADFRENLTGRNVRPGDPLMCIRLGDAEFPKAPVTLKGSNTALDALNCIYKLDGDTLTICAASPERKPRDFTDKDQALWLLKRKPAAPQK
jgi:RNA polymerase sigma factor (sigma-70 family)